MTRSKLLSLGCAFLLTLYSLGPVFAQNSGGGGGTSTTVVSPVTKSYTVEGIIMVALFAAATFAVCKSSLRGN